MSGTGPETIARLLCARAAQHPDAPFLIIDDERLDFRAVHARATRLARGMIAMGLAAGDHVAVLMPNSVDAAIVFYATHLARGVAVPINARFKRRELRHIVRHSDARFLFTTQAAREHVDFVTLIWDSIDGLASAAGGAPLDIVGAPALRHVIVFGDNLPAPAISPEDLELAAEALVDSRILAARADDIAFLLYTSGTTALPKGCELTHRAVIGSWSGYAEIIGLTADDGVWSPCPFFHIGGLGPMTAALVHGTRFLSMTHFDPELAVAMLERDRPRHLFPAFPTLTLALLRTPGYDKARFTFVKTVVNVSPPETQQMIQQMLPGGARLLNDFGMTEGSGIVTMTRPGDSEEQRLTSNGRAIAGIEVDIIDHDTGASLPQGKVGEIRFRGINALRSYYKDAEATAVTIDERGWVRSGDMGSIDAEGDLHFIGRLKDILKVGGENVAPAEVEAHLSTHPAVKMVQIVGRPDAKYGEVPVAFVELLDGAQADAAEIIAFCNDHLASFKIPREVCFIREWPMSATKIQKFRLRESLGEAPSS
jgi:acyl-CoA synthetase (AMP-forming)/AMP-acid ligase II